MNKKDIKALLTGVKFEIISEEESSEIQNILFDIGINWANGNKINHTDKRYLSIDTEGDLVYNMSEETFNNSDYPLISTSIIKALHKEIDNPKFKPFDKVLVRDSRDEEWKINLYSNYHKKNKNHKYEVLDGVYYKYCIPFEGNEHLLNTTDDEQ